VYYVHATRGSVTIPSCVFSRLSAAVCPSPSLVVNVPPGSMFRVRSVSWWRSGQRAGLAGSTLGALWLLITVRYANTLTYWLTYLFTGPFRSQVTGQVVCTHVPLSVTKQYSLVPVKRRWCRAAGKVTVGLASHWPCVTVAYTPTGSRPKTGRWALSTHPAMLLYSTFTLELDQSCPCILCDPIQPNPSAVWPNPIQLTMELTV